MCYLGMDMEDALALAVNIEIGAAGSSPRMKGQLRGVCDSAIVEGVRAG